MRWVGLAMQRCKAIECKLRNAGYKQSSKAKGEFQIPRKQVHGSCTLGRGEGKGGREVAAS